MIIQKIRDMSVQKIAHQKRRKEKAPSVVRLSWKKSKGKKTLYLSQQQEQELIYGIQARQSQ